MALRGKVPGMKKGLALAPLAIAATLALAATPALLVGCGSRGLRVASIQPGAMPEGKSWTAVFFNQTYGNLHIEESGANIRGRWQNGEKFGEMTGTHDGNVLHFQWKQLNTAFVGANAQKSGKGVFIYVAPDAPGGPGKLKGQWGYGDDELGGGTWDCIEQLGVKSDPDSLKVQGSSTSIPATNGTWDNSDK